MANVQVAESYDLLHLGVPELVSVINLHGWRTNVAFHIPNEGENSIRVLNQPHTAVGDAGG